MNKFRGLKPCGRGINKFFSPKQGLGERGGLFLRICKWCQIVVLYEDLPSLPIASCNPCSLLPAPCLFGHFAQRLRQLREWAATNIKQKTVRQKLLNLRTKSAKFQVAYDYPDAYRTFLYA